MKNLLFTTAFIRQYSVSCVEDLNNRGMLKKHKQAIVSSEESVLDSGVDLFRCHKPLTVLLGGRRHLNDITSSIIHLLTKNIKGIV